MRKELFFAILAGGILGLIIAFGVWRVNSSLSKNTEGSHTETSPLPTANNTFSLTLAKIENNDVIVANPLTLNGLTQPLSFIAISGESSDYLTQASTSGEFNKDINLDGGLNRLIIDSFDSQGSFSEVISTLVYSSEFAKYLTSSVSATPSSDTIRDKVQQKVDEALKKPKAYIGSITDITESTIQIKSPEGEILQLSINSSEVKSTDLAIGDYIVGMGIQNGNKVLEAKRILIASAPGEINRNILYGKITASTAKTITLETIKDKKSFTIAYDKNTDFLTKKGDKFTVIKIANVEDGKDIAFVFNTVNDDGSYLARTVIVLRDLLASPTPSSTPKI